MGSNGRERTRGAQAMIEDSSPQAKEQPLTTTSRPEKQSAATRPTKPPLTRSGNRRRTITMVVLAGILLLAGVFLSLTLLPSPAPAPLAGVPVGTVAPPFVLPMYGGGGNGFPHIWGRFRLSRAS